MSEDLNVFPNAKPIILGADTHAALLTGNAVQNLTQTVIAGVEGTSTNPGNANNFFRSDTPPATIATLSNITTPSSNSVMIIVIAERNQTFDSTTATFELKRGATLLDSFGFGNGGGGGESVTIVDYTENPAVVGTHDYTLVSTSNRNYGGIDFKIFFVDLDDTHAAILTGTNSQRTHEQAVLPA